MQVGETDEAKTKDAHKDTELTLIDGLDFFPWRANKCAASERKWI